MPKTTGMKASLKPSRAGIGGVAGGMCFGGFGCHLNRGIGVELNYSPLPPKNHENKPGRAGGERVPGGFGGLVAGLGIHWSGITSFNPPPKYHEDRWRRAGRRAACLLGVGVRHALHGVELNKLKDRITPHDILTRVPTERKEYIYIYIYIYVVVRCAFCAPPPPSPPMAWVSNTRAWTTGGRAGGGTRHTKREPDLCHTSNAE